MSDANDPFYRDEPSGLVGAPVAGRAAGSVGVSAKDRIIDATMELAAERDWGDFGLNEIATRAGVSLAEFREAFPSKGAVLAGLSRRIDKIVLDGTTPDLEGESHKERLFDVLMRRLDAMAPYRLGLESVAEWVRSDGLAAAALNQVALNSMRFMLAAAGIDTEGRTGAIKLQGLVIAWMRVLTTWFEDNEPGLARTMATLDRTAAGGNAECARRRPRPSGLAAPAARPRHHGYAAARTRARPVVGCASASGPGPRRRRPRDLIAVASGQGSAAPITYEDFLSVDIRVGTVVRAETFPQARKPALKLTIDFGEPIGLKRSSAQITRHYAPETLIGRQVAAVVNFLPRQIGPFMSEVLTLGFPDQQGEVVLIGPSLPVPDGGRLF